MTLSKTPTNTQFRSMPFNPDAGYSLFNSSIDTNGRAELNTAVGERLVTTRSRNLAISFQRGSFSDQVNFMNQNGGSVLEAGNLLSVIATNTGDVGQVRSASRADYQTGFETQAVFDAVFTDYQGTAVVRQEIGLMGNLNGYFFSAVSGKLAVSRRKAGVDVETYTQDEFNLDKIDGTGVSGFKIDITKINVYRIQFGFMGNMPTVYEVFGGFRLGWIAVHAIDFVNTSDFPEIENPFLPIQIVSEIVSGSPAKQIIVSTNNWYAGSLTHPKTWDDYTFFAKNVVVTNAFGETPVLALRNSANFRGFVNFIPAEISYLSAATGLGGGAGEIKMYKNPTVSGATWSDIETGESPIEFADNNFTINSGRYQGSLFIAQQANQLVQFATSELRLDPSDIIVFTANVPLSLSVRWGELR